VAGRFERRAHGGLLHRRQRDVYPIGAAQSGRSGASPRRASTRCSPDGSLLTGIGKRKGDRAAYRARKAAVADDIITRAEEFIPGLRAHITVQDAASPLTYERYGRVAPPVGTGIRSICRAALRK